MTFTTDQTRFFETSHLKKPLRDKRINICVYNESSSELCCFINAGSILMAFWGFMFSGLGDITGESAASSRPSCLGGFALSLPTCFQYPSAVTHFLACCARARFCLGLDRAPAPAPRAGKAGKTEKGVGARRGEERSSEQRGMEQIRNRCSHTCDSAFGNRAGTNYSQLFPSSSSSKQLSAVCSYRVPPPVEISIPPHCSP